MSYTDRSNDQYQFMLAESQKQTYHLRGIKNLLTVLTIVILLVVLFGFVAVIA